MKQTMKKLTRSPQRRGRSGQTSQRPAWRVLASALAVCLVFALLPAAALAADGTPIPVSDFSSLSSAVANAASTDPGAPTVIEVSGSFELTSVITPPAGKSIKLISGASGPYTLTMSSSFSDKRGFSITGDCTLILENIIFDGNSVAKPLFDVRSGNLVINEGTVLQNSRDCAVQIQVDNTADARPTTSVVMNGGEIKNNEGGGIEMNVAMMIGAVQQALSLEINGGKITGNGTADGSCGGIYVREMVEKATAQVTISGGEISGNNAKNGGGVFVDCPFKMTGGEITGNNASVQGGGIFISENQQPVISGGTITGNTAAGNSESPEKGKGNNIYTRSGLQLGSGVSIPDGVFLQTLRDKDPDTVLLLPATLNDPIQIEGVYRINPKPMVNMPVAKTADGNVMSQETFEKLSLEGMNPFRLAADESGVVRLGNAASGQPLVFYSEYGGKKIFDGTAPSQSGSGWVWEKGTKTLTLSGAAVDTADSYALILPEAAKVILSEGSTSTFSKTGNYYAVFGGDALSFSGPGKLVVNSQVVGVSAEGAIMMDGCEVEATGPDGGIYGYGDVDITGCKLKISGGIVIENGGKLTINGTAGEIDGAVQVMIPSDGNPADYIKIDNLPDGLEVKKIDESSYSYAAIVDSAGNEVQRLTLETAPEGPYTITFNANGGTVTPASGTTGADGKLSSLPTPARSGNYSFAGWYTLAAGGVKVTEDTIFDQNTAIFAHWTYTGSSGGSGSGGGSNITSSTTTNPDGSTTTTTTNKVTGTVTETTKAKDGTQTVVETKKDGSEKETVITPDGTKTETVTTAKGDMIYTEQRADGTRISADISGSGGAAATVDLPGNATAPVAVSFPVIDGTVVLRLLQDGTEEPVAFSLVEDGKVYVRLDGDARLRVETSRGLFDDMDGHWAEGPADFTGARKLFYGTAPRTFAPEQLLTRGMLATVLYHADGNPNVGQALFSDVDNEAWYADGVAWMADNGIAVGIGNGLFGVDRNITRQELAVMLWNYAKHDGIDVGLGEKTNTLSYTDIDEAGEWAIPALQWACGAGILKGYKDGTLDPAGFATRAEAAAMLEQFVAAAIK